MAPLTATHLRELEEHTQAHAMPPPVNRVLDREPAPARTIEERLAVVEATTDLAELKSSLTKWVLFSAAGVLVGVLGLVFTLHNSTTARIDQTNVRIDSAVAELRGEIRETNARIDQTNQRIDSVIEKMDAKFDQVNARFDQVNTRLDRLFELIASRQAAGQ